MTAAQILLERLRASGIRPRDLATVLGVDRSTASLMLRGKRGIPTWHLDAIARHLGVSVQSLFEPIDNHDVAPELTRLEARAWRFADSEHRRVAVTVLRLGRSLPARPEPMPTGIVIGHRRLIDYLREEEIGR